MGAVDLGGSKKPAGGGQGWKRPRVSIRIDMTPMVDIAFLLLIFFMVTTVFRLPTAMEMILPPPDEKPQDVKVFEQKLVTFMVLENDSLAWNVGNEPPRPMPWDSLRVKLQERRAALMKGTVEEVEAMDKIVALSDTNLMAYEQLYGRTAVFDLIDDATKKAELPRLSDSEKEKFMNDLKAIDGLTVLAKIHKNAKYASMINLVDEFNVVGATRFSIDKFTVVEDSLLRMNGFQTSGPEGLPEAKFEFETEEVGS